jgi:hypothetical protein
MRACKEDCGGRTTMDNYGCGLCLYYAVVFFHLRLPLFLSFVLYFTEHIHCVTLRFFFVFAIQKFSINHLDMSVVHSHSRWEIGLHKVRSSRLQNFRCVINIVNNWDILLCFTSVYISFICREYDRYTQTPMLVRICSRDASFLSANDCVSENRCGQYRGNTECP